MENHNFLQYGKIHYQWPFSIAMLVHQRVSTMDIHNGYPQWGPTLPHSGHSGHVAKVSRADYQLPNSKHGFLSVSIPMRANKNDRETQTIIALRSSSQPSRLSESRDFSHDLAPKNQQFVAMSFGKMMINDQPFDGMNLSIHFPRFSVQPMVPTQPWRQKHRWLFPREEAVKRMKEAADTDMDTSTDGFMMVLWTLRMNNRGTGCQRDITWNCGVWNSTGVFSGGLVWTTERGLTSGMWYREAAINKEFMSFHAQQSGFLAICCTSGFIICRHYLITETAEMGRDSLWFSETSHVHPSSPSNAWIESVAVELPSHFRADQK